MARKSIQGITIEIDGSTSKLQDALDKVEKKLNKTQHYLKDVNKLLKLDPGNTELLTQKQKLLTDAIQGTGEKLKTLRDAAEQANEQLANGEISQAQYDVLQREIIDTEQKLKSLNKEMQNFGSVTAQQVKAAGQQLQEFGDKMTNVGTSLSKNVTAPIVAVGAASLKAFEDVDAGMDIIVKKTGATGDALKDLQNRAKNLATSIPTDFGTAGEAIGEVNTRFDLTGDALEALAGKFIKFADLNNTSVTSSIDTVQAAMAAFGVEADGAGDVLDILNRAAQETGVDVTKLSGDLTTNASALREMGFGINTATGFLAGLNKNGLDSSTVLTGMKKALQNATKNGESMSQALDRMQKSILNAKSDTEAMSIATELFGAKAAPTMVSAIREGRISFDELSNSVTDWGNSVDNTFEETLDPIDGFKTAMNELKLVGMDLVEAAAPLIKQVAEALKNLFNNLRERWEALDPAAQETILRLAAIAAAVGPVLAVGGKLISGIGSLMTLAPLLTNPITLIIAGVAALVAAIVALWNKSEAFRNFFKNLWDNVAGFVGNAVEKIKRFFSFQWQLPKIPLPHFKIEGSFSIAPPRVPRLSIDWYKKAMEDGMILTSPTIFGAANGKLLGGGEAGPEAVIGVDSLRSMVQSAVSRAMPGGIGARNMTVILQLKETELARTVFRLNNSETQRVGLRLSGA